MRVLKRRPPCELTDDLTAPSDSPDFLVDRIAFERALVQLPEANRIVFVLKTAEGYSHEEIASLMNTTVETSRARLARARTELRRILSL